MAEPEIPTAAEAAPSTEESPGPMKETEAPEPVTAAVEPSAAPAEPSATPVESSPAADGEIAPPSSDHKRKLHDPDLNGQDEPPRKKLEISASAEGSENAADVAASDINGSGAHEMDVTVASPEVKEIAAVSESVDTDTVVAVAKSVVTTVDTVDTTTALTGLTASTAADDPSPLGNGEHSQPAPIGNYENPSSWMHTAVQLAPPSSRKMDIPNNKVGVLIGKAGETIKNLQFNSGAKIQITRDTEADPQSSTRPVELIGTPENIDKAEKLIRDVIAEADAGGSPALVAKGFGTAQSGGEFLEIPVPNDKVGLIIGKGGETIKNLQTRSGARVQLIPQHLPTGDTSKERVVRITGNKSQIEYAREMVKEVMNKIWLSRHMSSALVSWGSKKLLFFGLIHRRGSISGFSLCDTDFVVECLPIDGQLEVPRPSNLSGKYNQQGFPPRPPQWGPRAAAPSQQMTGYDYSQRGAQYPPQATQYPQTYGGYPQQPPPRSNVGAGWDQRPSVPAQGTNQTGGYDYYGQGTPAAGVQPSNTMPTPAPASVAPAPVNYNYGQPQAQGYGHPPPYAQSAPTQQSYGHGYNEPRYDQAPPSQQNYGQQPGAPPGVYGQQSTTPQTGYSQQQPYGGPAYGAPAQELPQTYGAPRASQPGDPMYQGQQMHSSYGQAGIPQQSYPYGSSAPSQPAYGQSYGPTSGSGDYAQQPSTYPQQGQVAPGYGQGGQPVAAYAQPGLQSGGYAQQYPQSQPSYGSQVPPSNVNYGYQGGPTDPSYANNAQVSGHGATPMAGAQPGYAQPPPGYYEQAVPTQSGQANMPATAPVGYTKSLSPGPQPGYGGQVYGQH